MNESLVNSISEDSLKKLANSLKYTYVTDSDEIGTLSQIKSLINLTKESRIAAVNSVGMIYTCNPLHEDLDKFKTEVKNCFADLNDNVFVISTDMMEKTIMGRIETMEGIENLNKDQNAKSDAKTFLAKVLKAGVDRGASDIHMRLLDSGLVVEFRDSGFLISANDHKLSATKGLNVTNIIYQECKDSISDVNLNEIMNGAFNWQIEQHLWRFRVSWQPLVTTGVGVVGAAYGESTIRILKPSNSKPMPIEQLRFPPLFVNTVRVCIKQKAGTILIGGPTGSGKSATAHALLDLVENGRKISALEDPVETINPRFRQTEVKPSTKGLTMYDNLRNMLRQDVDVGLVGEIRDSETAKMASQVAMNGHFLIATIHVDAAMDIYNYLVILLGLEPLQVASKSFGTIWMCQRLANVLCPSCAIPFDKEPDLSERKELAINAMKIGNYSTERVHFRNEQGCSKCKTKGAPGFISRIPVIEMIEIDAFGRDCIIKGDLHGWRAYLIDNGWKSLADHARYLTSIGMLDPMIATTEVGNLTQNVDTYKAKYDGCFSGGEKGSPYHEAIIDGDYVEMKR
ncbi:GspE/PulE family protein [Aliivibrio fischeri]|uniref:GspE/PulE family protein n=1 Tax=Aliivibrio fischeri TaxID=668 RepID=UPI0007C5D939|nr:ATPase, T2SS/T4P/T4SS family [Aliivibrio fischeri]